MDIRIDRHSLLPAAVLSGLAAAMIGFARFVQLVDDSHDVEEDDA